MRWILLLSVAIMCPISVSAGPSTGPIVINILPGQSLEAARDRARNHPGSKIILAGGTYLLNAPLVLTPGDSHVTWEAEPHQTPILSGGREITGWHRANLNGQACFTATIPEVKQGNWYFRALWINNRRAIRARSPNRGYFLAAESPDAGPSWDQGQNRFRFSHEDVPAGPFSYGAEAIVGTRWVESRLPIVGIDAAKHIASFSRKSQWRVEPGDPYWLEGDSRWLDQPGEWFLDRKTGTLYYIPRPGETLATMQAVAPRLSTLLDLNGDAKKGQLIESVTFRGITFSHTGWSLPDPDPATTQPGSGGFAQADLNVPAAITGAALRNCVFENCTISHAGTWGINLGLASQCCRIDQCTLSDLGAGGIRIGDQHIQQGAELQSFGNAVSDCEITGAGRGFPSATGIWIGQSFDNHIKNNHIHDLYYSGISAGWSWGYGDSLNHGNVIERNFVEHIGSTSADEGPFLSDLGGIYLLGARKGTVVRNNVFHDIAGVKYGGWGIYLDEGSSNVLIENNLVYHTTHGSFHLHYGADNIVRNNIFADASDQQIVRTRVEDHLSATFEHNIVAWDGKTPMTKTSPANVRFDHNLYLLPKPDDFRAGGKNWQQWQAAGEDAHSLIRPDAFFVDPAKDDFNFKSPPPKEIDFQPFDASDVGPRPVAPN
jgi:parallel beta-helix repeat protein